MEREEIVLDASVAIKWFTKEEGYEKAIEIRDRFIKGEIDLIVPDIILYEIANALRYNPKFNSADVEDAVKSIADMNLTVIVPIISILKKSVNLAFSKNITIYDSVYVALASHLNCKMITADQKLCEKVKNLDFVHLL